MSHNSVMSQSPATSSSSFASQSATTARLHMSSDSDANKSSILVSLSPEILIKILSEVPLSSFLALAHTSRGLRAFVKDNAARICNMAIRSRFAEHVKILEATTNNNQGWLLPGPGMLLESQVLYLGTVFDRCLWWQLYIYSACRRTRSGGLYYTKAQDHAIRGRQQTHFSLLGPKWSYHNVMHTTTNNFLHFGMPGPHFLHLLESVTRLLNKSVNVSRRQGGL